MLKSKGALFPICSAAAAAVSCSYLVSLATYSIEEHEVIWLQGKRFGLHSGWPQMLDRFLTDESELCGLYAAAFEKMDLKGMMESFHASSTRYPPAYHIFSPAGSSFSERERNIEHHQNHVLGAWAMEKALQDQMMTIEHVMKAAASRQSLSLYSGGFAGPLHSAIWHAIARSGLTDASAVWDFGLGLCSMTKSTVVPVHVQCWHGIGHGAIQLQNTSWNQNYSACTTLMYNSRLLDSFTVSASLRICHEAPTKLMAASCAHGVFDAWRQDTTPLNSDTSVLASPCLLLRCSTCLSACFFYFAIDCLAVEMTEQKRRMCVRGQVQREILNGLFQPSYPFIKVQWGTLDIVTICERWISNTRPRWLRAEEGLIWLNCVFGASLFVSFQANALSLSSAELVKKCDVLKFIRWQLNSTLVQQGYRLCQKTIIAKLTDMHRIDTIDVALTLDKSWPHAW